MDNNSNLLSLLSMVMDETLDTEDSDIQQSVNEINLIVDEQLVPAIEEIQYVNKYDIIEKIKDVCRNISLYMYFPGLIGKNVICFYHPSDIVRKGIYSRYLKKTFSLYKELGVYIQDFSETLGKKENLNLLMDDVPMYLVNDIEHSLISYLNVANKNVDVSYKEYISLLNHSRKQKMSLAKILDSVYVPVLDNLGNKAVSVIPEKCNVESKFYKTICDTADVLVVRGDEISKELLSTFQNIKTVFVQGKISTTDFELISLYCKEKEIELILETPLIFDALEDGKYNVSKNNFCHRVYIENLLYEITWFLAGRKKLFEENIAGINSDLLFKDTDLKAGIRIKKIQIQYRDTITEIESLYADYKEIIDILLEKIDSLQRAFGIQEGVDCLNNHIQMNEITIELLAKISETLKAFSESNAKEKVRNYKSLCDIYKDPLSDAIYERYMDVKTAQNIIDLAIKRKYKSDFIKRIQIQIGMDRNIDIQELAKIVETMNIKLSPIEYYILGKEQVNKKKDDEAFNNLIKAIKGGIEDAGKTIMSNYSGLSNSVLEELAEYGVASAAFKIGKKYADSNQEEQVDKGLKYLHIAAAKNNINAIKYLGDLSYIDSVGGLEYDDYYIDYSEDDSGDEYKDIALKYYLFAEKKGSKDIKMFERMFKIYFAKKNYKEAEKYCKKINSAESYFCLGIIYENGLGCASSEQKALNYYQKAMDMGHMNAEVAYERLTSKIAVKKAKNTVKKNTSYSSSSYYSGYYSGYSGGW